MTMTLRPQGVGVKIIILIETIKEESLDHMVNMNTLSDFATLSLYEFATLMKS